MRRRQLVCLTAGVGVAAWAATYHLILGQPHDLIVISIYLLSAALIVFYLGAVGFGRRFTRNRPATGRVVCIVPAYNEQPHLLRATIEALARQTIRPDEIHVMDDGSDVRPVQPFPHPLVTWHRQPNAGKRHAQAAILRTLDPGGWEFVLTVDSDSQPRRRAIEHLLQAMRRRQVMAATGLILTRNWRHNLLTRISDINIGTSCLMIRTSRSTIGAVETTSGALAIYRAPVIFDNLDDYTSSGTNGDDRRLTLYALLRGEVVVVNEAMVDSEMPHTVSGLFGQRLRWGKSAWQALPFSITNLSGKQLIFPLLAVVQWLLLPVMFTYLAVSMIAGSQSPTGALIAFAAYVAIRYAETGVYLMDRPGMRAWTKLWHWIVLTPVEMLVRLAVVYPAKYYAIVKLRERGWHTRGNAHPTATAPILSLEQRYVLASVTSVAGIAAAFTQIGTAVGAAGAWLALSIAGLLLAWPAGRRRQSTAELA